MIECETIKDIHKTTVPKITSIVVNWNLRDETIRCLTSLEMSKYPCRTIVIDNGSSDGSAETIRETFPTIEIISLPTNIGFARACNIGIQQILRERQDDFVFLLNNDATIHPLTLTKLIQSALTNPRAGIFGPKVFYRHPPQKIWYAGASRRRGVLAAVTPGRNESDCGQFDKVSAVDYVFGAAMFIRMSVFEKIGMFDDRFFLYLEDLDFCLRAQLSGCSLLFVPDAHVYHIGSASTSHNLRFRRYHQVNSSILFLQKHLPKLMILPASLFWTGVLLRMIVKDSIHGDLDLIRSYWSALINGLTEAHRLSWRRTE
jgi:GT2 family glycosyltransferase